MGFGIKFKITVESLNCFYKRNDNPKDYIFVCGYVKETGAIFYKNFYDFNSMLYDNNLLTCDSKYIKENFKQIALEQLQKELR